MRRRQDSSGHAEVYTKQKAAFFAKYEDMLVGKAEMSTYCLRQSALLILQLARNAKRISTYRWEDSMEEADEVELGLGSLGFCSMAKEEVAYRLKEQATSWHATTVQYDNGPTLYASCLSRMR